MTTFTLTQLQHSDDRRGPWILYVYEKDGERHWGGVWFMAKPKYPEELTIAIARGRCVASMLDGREVRVCDAGDMLVFHFANGQILHGETFWQDIDAGGAA
jgi:hypothetical protein